MCDSVCKKEVSLLCFVKFAALVLFRCWKKNQQQKKKQTRYQKKLDLSMSVVSSNNESEVSQKKELGWLGVSLVQMGMNSFM